VCVCVSWRSCTRRTDDDGLGSVTLQYVMRHCDHGMARRDRDRTGERATHDQGSYAPVGNRSLRGAFREVAILFRAPALPSAPLQVCHGICFPPEEDTWHFPEPTYSNYTAQPPWISCFNGDPPSCTGGPFALHLHTPQPRVEGFASRGLAVGHTMFRPPTWQTRSSEGAAQHSVARTGKDPARPSPSTAQPSAA